MNYIKIKVDIFISDAETDIIDNFPFDKITVDLWYIEHRNPSVKGLYASAEIDDANFIKK